VRWGALLVLIAVAPACQGDGTGEVSDFVQVEFDTGSLTFDTPSAHLTGTLRGMAAPDQTEVTWTNTTGGNAGPCGDAMVTTSGWIFGHYISVTTHKWWGDVDLLPGPNLVTITATDTQGHVTSATRTVTYVPTPPVLHIESPWGGTTFNSLESPLTFSGTASSGIALERVEWTNGLTGTSGIATGTGSWTAAVPLDLGTNTIVFRAVDVLGRTATDSMDVVYPASNPPPTITWSEPSSTGTFTTSETGVLVKGTAASPYGIPRVDCTCDETGLVEANLGSITIWNFWVPLAVGTNTIHITATDGIGGTTTTILVVTRNP
jgi:hypothetical protein